MMINRIRSVFDPVLYHGWGRTRRFFEGWYFKVVNAAEDCAFAFIPGIAMNERGERHAFVQVLDGKKLTATYHPFPVESFNPTPGQFDLRIEANRFTVNSMHLDLPGFSGELRFTGLTPWPSRWYSPGIMGPYTFVPFMECYHGIVSLDHAIEGSLQTDGGEISFSGGRGYSEKDWGHSFPTAYIWMQSNHFSTRGISLKASVARIPWLGSSFTGFIAGLWHEGRLYPFTTYNGSRLVRSVAGLEQVELIFANRNYRMEILARRDHATLLASPLAGFMDGRIAESMTSDVTISLFDAKSGASILKDHGRNLALEVAGNISEILVERT
ncbi:MAG: tocopherol cyclase family protein [Bacteroidales bacterium]